MRHDVNGAGAFPTNLVPAVRPGDFARLLPDGQLVKVEAFVPTGGIRVLSTDEGDDISVSANSSSDKQELTPLAMPDGQLGQVRIVNPGNDIPDGIEISVDYGGRQATFYQTKNREGLIDNETGTQAGFDSDAGSSFVTDEVQTQLLEYYVFEDTTPYFTFENTTGGSITVSDIRFEGYRFDVTEVTENAVPMGETPVPLPVERISAGRD